MAVAAAPEFCLAPMLTKLPERMRLEGPGVPEDHSRAPGLFPTFSGWVDACEAWIARDANGQLSEIGLDRLRRSERRVGDTSCNK